ncbi:MAG: hypothetical protein KGJ02_04340 [Verrucomicrobiota bacterium]|nr:hypothetical protein [Verrucomicrobiota bacterium]
MKIKDFFSFSTKIFSSAILAKPVNLKNLTPTTGRLGDARKLVTNHYEDIDFPVVFQEVEGKKWADLLDTGWTSLYLISENMKKILKDNNLTGWDTFDIKILDKKNNEVPGYSGFSVDGRCGKVDYKKCEIIQKRLVSTGPLVRIYKGLHIGLEEWDGTDFFLPEGTLEIIITSKAANVFKKNKLTNLYLKNLSEIETNESAVKIIEKRNEEQSF